MRRVVTCLAVLLAVSFVMADSASARGRRKCCRKPACATTHSVSACPQPAAPQGKPTAAPAAPEAPKPLPPAK